MVLLENHLCNLTVTIVKYPSIDIGLLSNHVKLSCQSFSISFDLWVGITTSSSC
jgi:hypothetical protein